MEFAQPNGILRSMNSSTPANSMVDLIRFCRIVLAYTIFYRGLCGRGIITTMDFAQPNGILLSKIPSTPANSISFSTYNHIIIQISPHFNILQFQRGISYFSSTVFFRISIKIHMLISLQMNADN